VEPTLRIFFDTNVLASALATRGLCADLYRLVVTEHELLTGEFNLAELRRVLRERFRAPPAVVKEAELALRQNTIVPVPKRTLEMKVRDPDDAWVLASAVAGGADVLVTGDKDLLSIAKHAPLKVLNPRQLWELLKPPG
jgi:putative PIN family toxin of toxin-antitoxin system